MSKRDDYRQQTKEDLENVPPMSRTQKIIIALAAIGVLACVAYVVFE